ncbi:MFS transporter [Oceanobacter sp. 4_MG-2023]|uniref:MFS transporter n=1 Tax=Oceanobacter sp. 4_MG-2023 TaxID=3062623 RepID=UPI0027326356|nr:MFS transporter [Oceanobacter sp. 4_MG-2023]MDP2548705.1 MFS transporter [Oceanobacter sp. 4_MG-2023]
MPAPAHRSFVAAMGISQMVSWGTLYYSFPLIAEAICHELGWSRADIYGAATLGLLAAALAAYPVGALIDRGHGRPLMVGATVAASLALLGWSSINTMTALYGVVITLGVLQAALSYEPAFAVTIRQLGTQQARSAITTITLWAGFASTVFIPLLQWMLDNLGWRGALLGLAAINIAVAAPLYFWAIRSATVADHTTRHQPTTTASPSSPDNPVRAMLYSPRFYLLTASFCFYMALFSGFTYHIYPLLVALSSDIQAVVFAIALIGPAQVGARLLLLLFREISIKHLGLLASVAFPLAILLLKAPPSAFTLAALCVLYGGANGIFTIVRGMAVPELLTRHHYGSINGIMLIPMSLARAAAPWLIAVYWTHSDTPDNALNLMLALAILVPVLFGLALVTKSPTQEHKAGT